MAIAKINWHPPEKLLKQFCLLIVGFASLVAAWQYYEYAKLTVSLWIVGIAMAVAAAGYRHPPIARCVYLAMLNATWPIGWTVSHLLMAVIFFLVFTPVRVMMTICGYDPMKRKIDKTAKTYWQTRPRTASPRRYFQQY